MADEAENLSLLDLTTGIVSAHISNNHVSAADLPGLIQSTYAALAALGQPAVEEAPAKEQGAVSVRKSLSSDDHIISMIDGKPYKALRRHLSTQGHTPESYREAYGLPRDYPMVSKSYSESRRALAKVIGLGRKAGTKVVRAAKAVEKKVGASVSPAPRRRTLKLSGADALARVRSDAE